MVLKMLKIDKINTFYGESRVLWDLSMNVMEGGIVALLGRNGMGKTTTMRSIMGFTPPRSGVIRFLGDEIQNLQSYKISRKGLALVPQGRGIFPSLSVKENLTLGARSGKGNDPWTLEKIYSLFPILESRAGNYANLLSGGEQQMMTIGRALMTNPSLILMDEPSEGLAPLIVQEVGAVVRLLKKKMPVLLSEQNANMALDLADYVYIIDKGRIVYESTPEQLKQNDEIKHKHLGV